MQLTPEQQALVDNVMRNITRQGMATFEAIRLEISIVNLQVASGLSREEIVLFVQSNVVSYEETCWFYIFAGRLPRVRECKAIRSMGIDNVTSLVIARIGFEE